MTEATLPRPEKSQVVHRPGSHLSDKDARLVYQVMADLADEERTATSFVEKARPEDSPIHHLIEWDDSLAAEHFRLQQAREHLRSVVFRVETNHTSIHYPVYFATKTGDGLKSYVTEQYLHSNSDKAEEVIERARRDLESFRKRYWRHRDLLVDALPELREVFPDDE